MDRPSVAEQIAAMPRQTEGDLLQLPWSRAAIGGALLSSCSQQTLPLPAWPLEAGLETLHAEAPSSGPVRATLDDWRHPPVRGRPSFQVAAFVRSLTDTGALQMCGKAIVEADPAWLVRCQKALKRLPIDDRAAIAAAAQVMDEMLTISSNTRAQAAASRSGTTRSVAARRQALTR